MGPVLITFFSLLLGCLLIAAYSRIAEATKHYQVDSTLARANQGLFTMGVVFLVSGIAFYLCQMNCGDFGKHDFESSTKMYSAFFLLLGIILVGLSATIINKIDSSGDGKTWAILILVTGLVLICYCVWAIGFRKHTTPTPMVKA